jgi:hypothetical protein
MQQSFKAFPAAKKTTAVRFVLEYGSRRLCPFIAGLYSWFYYLLFYRSRNFIHLNGFSFPGMKIMKLGIMKNLKDSMAGTDNNKKELNSIAARLIALQARELGLMAFAFRLPEIFLSYIRYAFFSSLDYFPFPLKGKNGFYLVFNLAGARLTLIAALLCFLEKGMSSVVLLNLEMIHPFIRMDRVIRAKGLEMVRERGGWVIRYEASRNPQCFARIVLLDPAIRSEIEYALVLIKKCSYNLFMIPEVPIREGKCDTVGFLGRKINLSSSLKKWSRFFDHTVMITTDSTKSLLFPAVSWFEDMSVLQFNDMLHDGYQALEKTVYVHPYLYIPFSFSAFWTGNIKKTLEEASVLKVIRNHGNRLVLMSDGRIFHRHRVKNHA